MNLALSQLNFRDIGGLRTSDGRRTKAGVIYRSEGPASFLDDHKAELRALRLHTICDLRSPGERDAAPHEWCGPECRMLNLQLNTDIRARGDDAWDSLRGAPSVENLASVLNATYRAMPYAALPHLRSISRILIDGETPILIHCTAGKDRTGVVVALFLWLLGVSEADIMADYAKTDPFMDNHRIRDSVEEVMARGLGVKPSRAMMELMLRIDEAHLRLALEEVSANWGGIAEFFAAGGVDIAEQKRLRAVLLI